MTSRTTHTTAVFYPETDGMPMPDAEYQGTMFREIVSTLATYYGDQPTTLVSGNTFIYYEEGNPQRRMAPDCYIIFDANRESIERNNTCLLWEMPGPPAFVLEIGSPSTAQTDLVVKRDLYARLGIGEYWRYDKTGGDFTVNHSLESIWSTANTTASTCIANPMAWSGPTAPQSTWISAGTTAGSTSGTP